MSTVLEGQLVVRREATGAVVIEQAPARALISLELLAAADPAVFKVSGRRITLGGQVVYRVAGWDEIQSCLIADLDEDLRGRP